MSTISRIGKTALERSGGLVLRGIGGRIESYDLSGPIARVQAVADGTVVVQLTGYDFDLELTPRQAHELAKHLGSCAFEGERRQKHLSGRDRWIVVERVAVHVRIEHDGASAWFRQSKLRGGHIRPSCAECRSREFAVAWVLRDGEPRGVWPSWKGVQICDACVSSELPRGLRKVHDSSA